MIRRLYIPNDWDYLFMSLYAKQNYIDTYVSSVKGPVKIYGQLNNKYVDAYKALCLIDEDFSLETIYPSEEGEIYLRSNLLPFSERFFVPDLTGLGFTVPTELQKKLEELSKKSKPIT